MSKIYISGKITGLDEKDVQNKFRSAEHAMLSLEYEVVNPLRIKPWLGIKNYWFYMIADIWELLFCDEILMLKDWKQSRGAKIEHWIAYYLRLVIRYD